MLARIAPNSCIFYSYRRRRNRRLGFQWRNTLDALQWACHQWPDRSKVFHDHPHLWYLLYGKLLFLLFHFIQLLDEICMWIKIVYIHHLWLVHCVACRDWWTGPTASTWPSIFCSRSPVCWWSKPSGPPSGRWAGYLRPLLTGKCRCSRHRQQVRFSCRPCL